MGWYDDGNGKERVRRVDDFGKRKEGGGIGGGGGQRIEDIVRKYLFFIVVAVVVIVGVLSSVYMIGPEQEGVVLRFGKYYETTDSGLHFKLPFGVDTVYKVPTRSVQKEEFGFRTLEPGVKTQYDTRSYEHEALMLTGDLNIGEVEWIVQFRISDSKNYLFKVMEPTQTVRDICESVMRNVIGDKTIDTVLLEGRQDIQTEVQNQLQEILDKYESGIKIVTVQLQNVTPPDPVKPSYNDVNKAIQDMEKKENEARAEYNREVPKAKGEALREIEKAEGYRLERVNHAEGNAKRFLALYEEYKKAKEVTRRRLYLETLKDIMPRVNNIYIVDESVKSFLPILDLKKAEGAQTKSQ
ncbi:MAG: FtsH protease activity modulator HflK [Myxococcota bacterium]